MVVMYRKKQFPSISTGRDLKGGCMSGQQKRNLIAEKAFLVQFQGEAGALLNSPSQINTCNITNSLFF